MEEVAWWVVRKHPKAHYYVNFNQVVQAATILANLVENKVILMSSPTGSGKTTTALLIVRKLKETKKTEVFIVTLNETLRYEMRRLLLIVDFDLKIKTINEIWKITLPEGCLLIFDKAHLIFDKPFLYDHKNK
jgi:superfamily II DNA or RNA helicase